MVPIYKELNFIWPQCCLITHEPHFKCISIFLVYRLHKNTKLQNESATFGC